MQITILDQLDFSEADLARLRSLGDLVQYNDIPSADEIKARLRSAEIAVVGWSTLDASTLRNCPHLRHVALALTGYEVVDLDAARELGISVSNIPGYSRQSVAEFAFALCLSLVRHTAPADSEVRRGNLVSPPSELLGVELFSKTLGILGLGDIGSWMARIGQGFGMRVLGHSRGPKNLPGTTDVDLDTLLTESDFLFIAVDTNPTTTGILNRERLLSMKRGAVLINITSNQVLDEDALADLLKAGHLRGGAFDDLSRSGHDDELRGVRSPLLESPNVLFAPQTGWYTIEAQERLLRMVVENVANFHNGSPTNIVT